MVFGSVRSPIDHFVKNATLINPFSAEPCVVNFLCGWQGVNGVYSCTNYANITRNTWASFPDNTKVRLLVLGKLHHFPPNIPENFQFPRNSWKYQGVGG